MSNTSPETERAPGSRLWRAMAIIALVLLVLPLAAALLWFFADPLRLSPELLATLDQRASVVGMFTGMALGTAGLIVAVVALRAQAAISGDNAGIVSTGDGAQNVQMRAQASGQGRVYQAGSDQTINER